MREIYRKKVADFGINISEVVAWYNESGRTSEGQFFSIEYRKADGSWGQKLQVRRYGGKGYLNPKGSVPRTTTAVEKDAQKFFLIEKNGTHPFEVFIGLVVRFNGRVIDHSK